MTKPLLPPRPMFRALGDAPVLQTEKGGDANSQRPLESPAGSDKTQPRQSEQTPSGGAMVFIGVRVSQELSARINRKAVALNITLSEAVRRAISMYVDHGT